MVRTTLGGETGLLHSDFSDEIASASCSVCWTSTSCAVSVKIAVGFPVTAKQSALQGRSAVNHLAISLQLQLLLHNC
jgi:hypothetical protein